MITINARKYVFTDFVQVLEQIDILERTQFVETTGAWSYYQILKHCTDHPFLRKTVGKYLLSKLLERGYMLPDGYNGQLETARIEGDDRLALSQLKAAIYSFRKFNKDFAIHPLYDTMDKPTWEKFHSIHIANHLSFVEIFPIELEFDDNLQDTFFQQGVSTPKILSVSSLSKLEAQDGMIRKRKSKSKTKIKSVVQKRKR
jgi:hypothetical protein